MGVLNVMAVSTFPAGMAFSSYQGKLVSQPRMFSLFMVVDTFQEHTPLQTAKLTIGEVVCYLTCVSP